MNNMTREAWCSLSAGKGVCPCDPGLWKPYNPSQQQLTPSWCTNPWLCQHTDCVNCVSFRIQNQLIWTQTWSGLVQQQRQTLTQGWIELSINSFCNTSAYWQTLIDFRYQLCHHQDNESCCNMDTWQPRLYKWMNKIYSSKWTTFMWLVTYTWYFICVDFVCTVHIYLLIILRLSTIIHWESSYVWTDLFVFILPASPRTGDTLWRAVWNKARTPL